MIFDSDSSCRTGAPWIERKDGTTSSVTMSLTGPGGESIVTFESSKEWEIIKARIEAAWAGQDANLSSFYPSVTHVGDVVGRIS